MLALRNAGHQILRKEYAPDGFNIGVDIGEAGGQSRPRLNAASASD